MLAQGKGQEAILSNNLREALAFAGTGDPCYNRCSAYLTVCVVDSAQINL